MSGRKFGKLTVVKLHSLDSKHNCRWECLCECGNTAFIAWSNLREGQSSCGCTRYKRTHGLATKKNKHPLYYIWAQILQRCLNPNSPSFHKYGGRGISVCHEWRKDFPQFLKDIRERPSGKYTVGRIDNDGHYTPANCHWETYSQQNRNKRNCPWYKKLVAAGKTPVVVPLYPEEVA